MFSAATSRRVLAPGEPIEPLLARAAASALEAAGLRPDQIDRLYGAAVLGKHVEPSPLYAVHAALGLRASALVAPQGTNFTGFLTGIALAAEAVRAGAARYVLVVGGARMSPHVEPGTGYAVSIGDGAGACVVGPGERDVIVDWATDTAGSLYDATTMDALPPGAAAPGPCPVTFGLSPSQLREVHDYGVERPPALIAELLHRNGVSPSDVSLIAHQPSRVLMDHWRRAVAPGQYVDTFDEHGNATVASVPMTLAARAGDLSKSHLVLMSPGMGMHAIAVLVRR